MVKVKITPVKASGVAPYEISGTLTSKVFNGERIYYIAGQSFPASIVTVLEAEKSSADRAEKPKKKGA